MGMDRVSAITLSRSDRREQGDSSRYPASPPVYPDLSAFCARVFVLYSWVNIPREDGALVNRREDRTHIPLCHTSLPGPIGPSVARNGASKKRDCRRRPRSLLRHLASARTNPHVTITDHDHCSRLKTRGKMSSTNFLASGRKKGITQ